VAVVDELLVVALDSQEVLLAYANPAKNVAQPDVRPVEVRSKIDLFVPVKSLVDVMCEAGPREVIGVDRAENVSGSQTARQVSRVATAEMRPVGGPEIDQPAGLDPLPQ